MAALEVVRMTTISAASDEGFSRSNDDSFSVFCDAIKATSFRFQLFIYFIHIQKHKAAIYK